MSMVVTTIIGAIKALQRQLVSGTLLFNDLGAHDGVFGDQVVQRPFFSLLSREFFLLLLLLPGCPRRCALIIRIFAHAGADAVDLQPGDLLLRLLRGAQRVHSSAGGDGSHIWLAEQAAGGGVSAIFGGIRHTGVIVDIRLHGGKQQRSQDRGSS